MRGEGRGAHSLCSLGWPMCSPWMRDLLSNVLAERDWGRALQDRPGEVIKGADFLPGITREEEERFDQRG